MIKFDTLPKDKPNQNNVEAGEKKSAVVFKSEMRESKTTHSIYLNVSFKLDDGGFVNENYFDSDKPFLCYKLNRLLEACKVQLEGEGTLKDVAKVIANKSILIDVVLNDRGYGAVDYSGDHDGLYPVEEPEVETDGIWNDVNEAIDEDF